MFGSVKYLERTIVIEAAVGQRAMLHCHCALAEVMKSVMFILRNVRISLVKLAVRPP